MNANGAHFKMAHALNRNGMQSFRQGRALRDVLQGRQLSFKQSLSLLFVWPSNSTFSLLKIQMILKAKSTNATAPSQDVELNYLTLDNFASSLFVSGHNSW